jgi:hypothetical protein
LQPWWLLGDEQRKKKTVTVGPTVLGEMQLPIHLREDGLYFGGHRKRKGYWRLLERKK